ncbi:MAG TPA: hypothetical protein VGC81_02550 [Candidatus Methylomirabilis sp.]
MIIFSAVAVTAQTTRIFYRAEDWLTTSPETQTLLVTGILRAWEQIAEAVEARGPAGEELSIREREALQLMECIRVSPGLTLEEVRQAIHAYAATHPTDIFSTVGDMAGRALDRRCPAPPAR